MLTVRFRSLGLRPGDRLLDLGSGRGRHAFEAAKLGARAVAADLDLAALAEVQAVTASMTATGQVPRGAGVAAVGTDALALPFPDGTFDRIIASEVMEHLADDAGAASELARVLRPGGTIAVTVPSWLPEQLCWRLSDDYHAPHVPGGHLRIYSRNGLARVLRRAGLRPFGSHRTHALHSPYWWLRCAVGPDREDHPLVAAYHRVLIKDIVDAPAYTRIPEKVLAPMLGKSLVVYARRPARGS